MKKIILTVIVILACAVNAQTWTSGNGRQGSSEQVGVVYHAEKGNVQFDYSWGSAHSNQMWTYERTDINNGWIYVGGTFEFTSDYVWTDFDTRLDERKGNPGNIIEYGYYTIGKDGHASDPIALVTKDADGNTIENSVIFQKGEKIGIYMTLNETNGNQVTFTSSKSNIEGASAAVPNVDTDSRGDEKQYFCLFDNRQGKGIGDYSHYEFHFGGLIASNGSYEEFLEQVIEQNDGNTNITDSTGNPVSGQPLPGTLATILISGLCAKALSKKNKKH
jgi:hypothetical protein